MPAVDPASTAAVQRSSHCTNTLYSPILYLVKRLWEIPKHHEFMILSQVNGSNHYSSGIEILTCLHWVTNKTTLKPKCVAWTLTVDIWVRASGSGIGFVRCFCTSPSHNIPKQQIWSCQFWTGQKIVQSSGHTSRSIPRTEIAAQSCHCKTTAYIRYKKAQQFNKHIRPQVMEDPGSR